MNQQIRKRVQFSETDQALLSKQVAELAQDVLERVDASVALDGTNGPLSGAFDAGQQEVSKVRTLTHGETPAVPDPGGELAHLTVDWDAGQQAAAVLVRNMTSVQFLDPPGIGTFVLLLTQGSTGGAFTVAGWDDRIIWVGGAVPVITVGSGARDALVFYYDGENYYGEAKQDYS